MDKIELQEIVDDVNNRKDELIAKIDKEFEKLLKDEILFLDDDLSDIHCRVVELVHKYFQLEI